VFAVASPASSGATSIAPTTGAGLDCNGFSPAYKTGQAAKACTDIRGIDGVDNSNTWDGRFYDNGHYIGHDEPDVRYLSSVPGSGNDLTWTETLGDGFRRSADREDPRQRQDPHGQSRHLIRLREGQASRCIDPTGTSG
jgi:hypothetical protein